MTSPRSLLAAGPLLAVVAALTLAPPALADLGTVSTVAFDGSGALVWNGNDQQNFMSAYVQDDGTLLLMDNGDGQIQPLDGHCVSDLSYSAICDMPTAIHVSMGGARDIWSGSDANVPITVDGGAGDDDFAATDRNDEYHGGPGNDLLKGGKGNDILDGGDGNDEIHGDEGADQIQGGAGDDTLTADGFNVSPSADVIDGGPGQDQIVSEWAQDVTHPTPISVTLGGGADDGRPGENDDVRNVEKIAINLPGTYVGSPGDDEMTVRQILDPVTMSGGAGNDKLRTGDGNDTLDGGPGADYLDGGYGDDHIVGGPGADIIHGDIAGGDCGGGIYGYCKLPYGNDTIDARDGEIDSIDCGAGTDTVLADANDVVAPDCENVTRSSGGGSGSGGGGGQGGGGTGSSSGSITAAVTKVSLAKALAKGLTVKVAVPGAGRLTAQAKRSGKLVASGKATPSAGGGAAVKLKFTKAAQRSLRHKASAKLAVTVTFAPTGGAAQKRTVKVTLHR